MASGLRDWKIQRLTAVVLAAYLAYFCYQLQAVHPHSSEAWRALMQAPIMQISTTLALVALLWHAWIGVWTIVTDYVKPLALRVVVLALIVVALCAEGVWGLCLVLRGAV